MNKLNKKLFAILIILIVVFSLNISSVYATDEVSPRIGPYRLEYRD